MAATMLVLTEEGLVTADVQGQGWEERLAAYFGHQIRSDTSVVYGDGFRLAHQAFQEHGLGKLLEHVRQTGAFPPCSA